MACLGYNIKAKMSEAPSAHLSAKNLKKLLKFLTNGDGPFTSNTLEATAFVDTGLRTDLNGAPDLQIHFISAGATKKDLENFNFKQSVVDALLTSDDEYAMTICPTILHPKSIGEISLSTSDPFESPLINPNYLENDGDVKLFMHGIRLSHRIITESKSFVEFKPEFASNDTIYGNHHPFMSDAYLDFAIRHMAATVYHPTSTCRIAKDEQNGVVDKDLKVFGVRGLRIADTSVMPSIIGANTNAPAIMIGEKAAHIIKQAYA